MTQCPICNTSGAYVGLFAVECANEGCQHFNIKAPGYKPKVYSIPRLDDIISDIGVVVGNKKREDRLQYYIPDYMPFPGGASLRYDPDLQIKMFKQFDELKEAVRKMEISTKLKYHKKFREDYYSKVEVPAWPVEYICIPMVVTRSEDKGEVFYIAKNRPRNKNGV